MTSSADTNWKQRVEALLEEKKPGLARNYAQADVETIERALSGLSPEDASASASGGTRMVFNLSSAHVPAFVEASRTGDGNPYKNGYDTGKLRIGAMPAKLTRRERLDTALSKVMGCAVHEIYYGAVELNGTGVRFYGDICFVLKSVDEQELILDRNSYDLFRKPISLSFSNADDEELLSQVRQLTGRWKADLARISALKIIPLKQTTGRRITTGDVSDGLLRDEDYVEALRRGSFAARDLQEARITAADAARESHILDRERRGPTPSPEASEWARQRREAERALERAGVPVRTITESGRVKS